MSEDVYTYLAREDIAIIEEVGDRLTITDKAGKCHVFEGVSAVEWAEQPALTYWESVCEPDKGVKELIEE